MQRLDLGFKQKQCTYSSNQRIFSRSLLSTEIDFP